MVVAKQAGKAGEFWNITYPGFAGVLTGVAKGRFAIAINQAPLTRKLGPVSDWVRNKIRNFTSTNTPPALLLRQVFEDCASYDEAVEVLTKTPLATNAIFTVAGTESGQSCVIERTHDEAIVHDQAVCATNHWQNKDWKSWVRPTQSGARYRAFADQHPQLQEDFGWVTKPIMNGRTRMALEANPRTGEMKLVGIDNKAPVTKVLSLS